jgi:hypothetical protein
MGWPFVEKRGPFIMNFKKINRISKLTISAIVASLFTTLPLQTASAHNFAGTGAVNSAANAGTLNGSLFVAVETATTAVSHTSSVVATGHTVARSTTGLIFKDATSGTAQTATVESSTVLSLYAQVSTTSAFSVSGGTLAVSATAVGMTMTADAYTSAMTKTLFVAASGVAGSTATPVAVLYTAPATAGTYTVTFDTAAGTAASTPTLAAPTQGTSHVLTITVLASATANHSAVGGTNNVATDGRNNESLYTAVASNVGTAAVVGGGAGTTGSITAIDDSALSKGLLSKDSSNGTAQTATVLAGGALSLYASVSTAVAFRTTGGTFSSAYGGSAGNTPYYNSTNTYVGVGTATTSTGVAVIWTAPIAVGTYAVQMLTGFATNSTGGSENPTASNGLVPPTLSAAITVTVVAASAGGSYSAAFSACQTTQNLAGQTATTVTGVDSTASVANGGSWAIALKLRDAYNAALTAGNLVATATNGALLSWGSTAGTVTATPLAGTGSTVVAFRAGSLDALRIDQGTAGAPLTTTVTISFNGTTVCTKTVSIAGKVATLEVSAIQTQDLSTATHTNDIDASGRTSGQLFQVVAKDSAGNRVATDGLGTFSADSASLAAALPTVSAISIAHSATATSSTSAYSYSTGLYTCGAAAGTASMKIRFTTTGSGETITSPAFTLRCADNPYTYTASWDKASYVQGEVATLTVAFKDSKGNPANNVVSPGAATFITPMLTAVTTTGSASMLPSANGSKTYTFTVGTASGMTAGTYTSIIDFTGLTDVAAEKATPTYKLTTASTDVAFTEVLKSVVALIASINKQIQALQKLILRR